MAFARLILAVVSDIERFGYDAALQCNVPSAARTDGFVDTPANRDVIEDRMIGTGESSTIHRFTCFVTNTNSQVTQDDVMSSRQPNV